MNTDQQQAVATWLTERGIPVAPPGRAGRSVGPEPDSGIAETEPGTGKDPEADPYAVARTIALRKLTVQARTRHELDAGPSGEAGAGAGAPGRCWIG